MNKSFAPPRGHGSRGGLSFRDERTLADRDTIERGGSDERPWVGRGALKLRHALDAFGVSARGLRCADLGCSTGGFTDCLLRDGAARVVAVDTGYGVLDYRLRIDPRVVVRERTNALHAEPAGEDERADLVVIDLGWTPQRLALPAALRWLRESGDARIITLVKPHYERSAREGGTSRRGGGVLTEEESRREAARVIDGMPEVRVVPLAAVSTPPLRSGRGAGEDLAKNVEWLVLARRA